MSHDRTRRRRAAISGGVAAAVALSAAELVGGLLSGGGSLFAAVGDAVIEAMPGAVVRFAIETFGGANRLVLFLSMTIGMFAAGALIGRATLQRRWVGPAALAAFGLLGALAGLGAASLPAPAAVIGPTAGAVTGTGVLFRLLTRPPSTEPDSFAGEAVRTGAAGIASRRVFLQWAAAATAAAATMAVAGRFLHQRAATAAARIATELPRPARPLPPPPADAALDVDGISELITPNDGFFRIDSAFTIPRVDPDTHAIWVVGMVDRPVEISYGELLDLADTEVDVTLSCVSNEVGGDLVGNARWQGVPLSDLLDLAGVRPDADQIVGRSVDGWTGGFPVDVARDGRPAIVAVGMNGEPLPARHGFPARLVIAGLYGYVSDTKWLSEIELTTFDAYDAYWVQRGWAERGPIKTQSRIDVPQSNARVAAGTTPIAGVAWAGERGVSAVEVAVDDGPWQPAELAAELATTTWRQWVYRWDATPGDHALRVRATDGLGETQTSQVASPAPDGATGHHRIHVSVA